MPEQAEKIAKMKNHAKQQVGKRRLEEEFGLEVVEMPHTLKGSEYIYDHPEKRAEE